MRIKIYLLVLILTSTFLVYPYEKSWLVGTDLLLWVGAVVSYLGCIYFTVLYILEKGTLNDFLMHKLFLFLFMIIYFIISTIYIIYSSSAFLFTYELFSVFLFGLLIYIPALYISFFYIKKLYYNKHDE